jgi:membrane-bound lytic murein transglycosylase B
VGYPQFISTSYQTYAVDFSGDGLVDLIDQPVDAIGSVANYFVENGWRKGEPVSSNAFKSAPNGIAAKANRKRATRYTAESLRALGAPLDANIENSEMLNVLSLNPSDVVRDAIRDGEYIVRAGDSACKIAERLQVPCKVIFELNDLDTKGTIYRGQKLKVPTLQESVKKEVGQKWVISNPEAKIFFYTHENFYVITRYNHSVLYAMAVNELSKAIKAYRSGNQYQWN